MSGSPRKVLAGGYEIGGVLGIGTYGEVRYGRSVATGQRVAIKIVDLSRFNDISPIIKEIKILQLLDHENCIKLIEVKEKVVYKGKWCDLCACSCFKRLPNGSCRACQHSGADHSNEESRPVMMIVQELAAGGELFGLLMHCGAFNEEFARHYFRQLLAGLEYCHSRGVIHRDLKPENLVLDGKFQLKLVDFGLAALIPTPNATVKPPAGSIGSGSSGSTGADGGEAFGDKDKALVLHSGVGSQPYSAPEVYYAKDLYQGRGYRGQPADIWSIGVILFVMLTGRPPFVRPLTKTYNQNLRRCKHFINLLKGNGYEGVSASAKSLLQSIFQLEPNDRPTIEKLKADAWVNGPTPAPEVLTKTMESKAFKAFQANDKPELTEVLAKIREEADQLPPLPARAGVGIPIPPGLSAAAAGGAYPTGSPPLHMPSASLPLSTSYDIPDQKSFLLHAAAAAAAAAAHPHPYPPHPPVTASPGVPSASPAAQSPPELMAGFAQPMPVRDPHARDQPQPHAYSGVSLLQTPPPPPPQIGGASASASGSASSSSASHTQAVHPAMSLTTAGLTVSLHSVRTPPTPALDTPPPKPPVTPAPSTSSASSASAASAPAAPVSLLSAALQANKQQQQQAAAAGGAGKPQPQPQPQVPSSAQTSSSAAAGESGDALRTPPTAVRVFPRGGAVSPSPSPSPSPVSPTHRVTRHTSDDFLAASAAAPQTPDANLSLDDTPVYRSIPAHVHAHAQPTEHGSSHRAGPPGPTAGPSAPVTPTFRTERKAVAAPTAFSPSSRAVGSGSGSLAGSLGGSKPVNTAAPIPIGRSSRASPFAGLSITASCPQVMASPLAGSPMGTPLGASPGFDATGTPLCLRRCEGALGESKCSKMKRLALLARKRHFQAQARLEIAAMRAAQGQLQQQQQQQQQQAAGAGPEVKSAHSPAASPAASTPATAPLQEPHSASAKLTVKPRTSVSPTPADGAAEAAVKTANAQPAVSTAPVAVVAPAVPAPLSSGSSDAALSSSVPSAAASADSTTPRTRATKSRRKPEPESGTAGAGEEHSPQHAAQVAAAAQDVRVNVSLSIAKTVAVLQQTIMTANAGGVGAPTALHASASQTGATDTGSGGTPRSGDGARAGSGSASASTTPTTSASAATGAFGTRVQAHVQTLQQNVTTISVGGAWLGLPMNVRISVLQRPSGTVVLFQRQKGDAFNFREFTAWMCRPLQPFVVPQHTSAAPARSAVSGAPL